MGNTVFRYFLSWLKFEMQKEAYARYIANMKRRAKASQQQAAAKVEDAARNAAASAGWLSGVVNGFDDWLSSYFIGDEAPVGDNDGHILNGPSSTVPEPDQTAGSPSTSDDSETTKPEVEPDREHARLDDFKKKKQLWELAKIEGDDDFKDWLESHIWTCVGLSAPLIGAIGNLRAVLSGENMGLPMTDDVARGIELCEC